MLTIIANIIILIICTFVINKGADYLGECTSKIAIKKKLPANIRGVLLDGTSSSLPELITSVIAAFLFLGVFTGVPDHTAFEDVGIGTIGGSAIFNILVIPFLSILFVSKEKLKSIKINKKAMLYDLTIYLIAVIILLIASYSGQLTPFTGFCMTGFYCVYAWSLLRKSNNTKEEFEEIKESYTSLFIKGLLSLIPIVIAINYAIESATILGTELGISRLIMSLVVLAAVTSIPDACLSIKSAKKGELDASISNAVGSNSFDILICLGLVIFLSGATIKINFSEVSSIFVFLISSSICYTIAFLFEELGKELKLIILAIPYIAFIISLIN